VKREEYAGIANPGARLRTRMVTSLSPSTGSRTSSEPRPSHMRARGHPIQPPQLLFVERPLAGRYGGQVGCRRRRRDRPVSRLVPAGLPARVRPGRGAAPLSQCRCRSGSGNARRQLCPGNRPVRRDGHPSGARRRPTATERTWRARRRSRPTRMGSSHALRRPQRARIIFESLVTH
jgi:hypothetical protein